MDPVRQENMLRLILSNYKFTYQDMDVLLVPYLGESDTSTHTNTLEIWVQPPLPLQALASSVLREWTSYVEKEHYEGG